MTTSTENIVPSIRLLEVDLVSLPRSAGIPLGPRTGPKELSIKSGHLDIKTHGTPDSGHRGRSGASCCGDGWQGHWLDFVTWVRSHIRSPPTGVLQGVRSV